MTKSLLIAALVGLLCTACASTSARFAGRYDRAQHIYSNPAAGFNLTLPSRWATYASPTTFTVPQQLRPDQEQVLEAYDPASKLGVIIVVQQGPVAEVADLLQRMQTTPEDQLSAYLSSPQTTDVRQRALRAAEFNGLPAVEWIYTAQDTTGGQPLDVTVQYYILKVRDNYVHVAFSIPSPQYEASSPIVTSIMHTFQTLSS